MKNFIFLVSLALAFFISPGMKAQTEDAGGCKDHPIFSCTPDYRINKCVVKESDTFSFPVESRIADDVRKQTIEGKYYFYSYGVKEGAQGTSALLKFRGLEDSLIYNYGFVVARVIELGNSSSFITGRIIKDNLDTWIFIQAHGPDYQLTVVEKQRKVQIIMADEMWNALDKADSVTLDIFFDNDTTIFPASLPIIDQVYNLLISHPSLKLSIQAHTDNARNNTGNKVSSADRAKVVQDALTAKGIDKKRLSSLGWGADKPIADNNTIEGRAKNRRIVIVKKQE